MAAMSERPTLAIAASCPKCGGTGSFPHTARRGGAGGQWIVACPDCTDGTIRQAVSCQSCKWWERDCVNSPCDVYGQCGLTLVMANQDIADDAPMWAECTCDDPNNRRVNTLETFGCLSWEAKA